MRKIWVLLLLSSLVWGQAERFEKMLQASYSGGWIPVHESLKAVMISVRTPNLMASFIPTLRPNGDLVLENYVDFDFTGQQMGPVREVTLPRSYTMDIESDRVGAPFGDSDLYYHAVDEQNSYLEMINGAEYAYLLLETFAMPMAGFQDMLHQPSTDIQPTALTDHQGWDWAAMAPVYIPRNALVVRVEAELTNGPSGYVRVQLHADQSGQDHVVADLSGSGNGTFRVWMDDASPNFNHDPFRETLFIQAEGTGSVQLHSVRVVYLMP